jgi:3-hydroxy-9,10-secoandrosta-1,3,5(10)-triene-9,17-dione monooxygenase reductase component
MVTPTTPPQATKVDALAFRQFMSHWASGVSVVTTRSSGTNYGLPVNAFLSISLEPPQVLISLGHDADTTPVIQESGRFAINVLAVDQREVSEQFARAIPSPAKFEAIGFRLSDSGLPLVSGTLGSLECQVTEQFRVSDHFLVVGKVLTVTRGRAALPLIFYRSRYGEADGPDRVRLATAID